MLLKRRRPSACAVCGGPLGEGGPDAHGLRFHSALCLRKFERDARARRPRRGGGGGGGCH